MRPPALLSLAPLIAEAVEAVANKWRAITFLLSGAPGTGKSWLATKTCVDIPGSLYLAADESPIHVGRRAAYFVAPESPIRLWEETVEEASGFRVERVWQAEHVKEAIASQRTGILCFDSVAQWKTATVLEVMKFHRVHGHVPMLVLDTTTRRGNQTSHHADVDMLQERDQVIELKHRYREGPTRRFPFDIRAIAPAEALESGWVLL